MIVVNPHLQNSNLICSRHMHYQVNNEKCGRSNDDIDLSIAKGEYYV